MGTHLAAGRTSSVSGMGSFTKEYPAALEWVGLPDGKDAEGMASSSRLCRAP